MTMKPLAIAFALGVSLLASPIQAQEDAIEGMQE